LVVLAGRACGHRPHVHIEAAAFIEFIHTATLLHDDVVDGSSLRRGRDTANLFEAGAEVAAVLAGSPEPVRRALAAYGRHLGTAYQLVDDVLDYRSNPIERGKN